MFQIKEVDNRNLLKVFFDLPFIINKNTDNWVAPLMLSVKKTFSSNNPLWQNASYKLYLAYQNNTPVARFALINNRLYDSTHKCKTLFFGFLEFINNPLLVNTIAAFIKTEKINHNYTQALGPVNPTTNYELGVLIDGFEKKPAIMMTYNQPYYNDLLLNAGAKKEMDFFSYRLPVANYNTDCKVQRIIEKLKDKYYYKIEAVDFSNFDEECTHLCDIYNDAFSDHWGSTYMTVEEFKESARQMQLFMNKKLIFKLLINNFPVAFILGLPDLNEVLAKIRDGKLFPFGLFKLLSGRKKIENVKILVAAIRKQYHHSGLGAILYQEMYERVKQAGYKSGELSWVAENNHNMNKIITIMNAQIEKKYRIYSL